jgi:hypothetical protein
MKRMKKNYLTCLSKFMQEPPKKCEKYEELIWAYKKEDLRIIEAIMRLWEECLPVEGGLGMAKEIVSSHPAYSAIHEATRPLHEAAFSAAESMSLEDAEETAPNQAVNLIEYPHAT